ncbi:hypothetical protein RND81_01G073300 [Saponaria officinalis]|uniref:Uncharacterized protein n=1 Tax=Saponaria officinalis TaxID=3572 RepID=A0AAW1NDE0_SAPOF
MPRTEAKLFWVDTHQVTYSTPIDGGKRPLSTTHSLSQHRILLVILEPPLTHTFNPCIHTKTTILRSDQSPDVSKKMTKPKTITFEAVVSEFVILRICYFRFI